MKVIVKKFDNRFQITIWNTNGDIYSTGVFYKNEFIKRPQDAITAAINIAQRNLNLAISCENLNLIEHNQKILKLFKNYKQKN